MSTKIIDGKAHAAALTAQVKAETDVLSAKVGRFPGLATILVGEDPASHIYVSHKRKKARSLGFTERHLALPATTSEGELLGTIDSLKKDSSIDGILVQLPLPERISVETVIATLGPEKDVDGFHPANLGEVFRGWNESIIAPCTPYGVIELLDREKVPLRGQHAVVVGRSAHVSRPLAAILCQRGSDAAVTVVHRNIPDITPYTKMADILIVAVGKENLITADMVKDGVTIIDIGINRRADGSITGDVDFPGIFAKAAAITPVPGGVGPMTIAALMQNTLKLFKRHHKLF